MSHKQKNTAFFLTLVAGAIFLFVAGIFFIDPVHAQIPLGGLLPECDFYGDPEHGKAAETYGLGAFVELAARLMKLIWGIVGSLALLMFVWGGFQWLTAAGEESRVKAGWDTFINATIGIVIILGSWVIINTVMLFVINPQGGFKVADIFGQKWVELATKDSICVNVAENIRGFVPKPMPVKADCGVYCQEEATKRNLSYIGTLGLVCTPGTVDTGSGSAGYTRVCIEKSGTICNCELQPVSVGTPNCGTNNCVTPANDLFCEPAGSNANTCQKRLTIDKPCRSPAVERECAEGFKCTNVGGTYLCKELPGATTQGICCYQTVVANNVSSGVTEYSVKAVSGPMNKQACRDTQPPAATPQVLGNLGIRWSFCPSPATASVCGAKLRPFTASGMATVKSESDSDRWSNLITSAISGCTIFVPEGAGIRDINK